MNIMLFVFLSATFLIGFILGLIGVIPVWLGIMPIMLFLLFDFLIIIWGVKNGKII